MDRLVLPLRRDDVDAVRRLVEGGTPIDRPSDVGSALFHALMWRSYDVAAYLLQKGAKLRPEEYGSYMPTHIRNFREDIRGRILSDKVHELLNEILVVSKMPPGERAKYILQKEAAHRRFPLVASYPSANASANASARKTRKTRKTRKLRRGARKSRRSRRRL